MKNVLKFLIFILYTFLIFFSDCWQMFLIEFCINVLVMMFLKTSLKKAIKNLLGISIFIVITTAVNALIVDLFYALLICTKLILVCNITYSFSKVLSYTEFAKVIEIIFIPLKIFKINSKDISLIICIAIAFIPILKDEFLQIRRAIKLKGYKLKLNNSSIIFRPFFISIFERVNEVSNSLKAKAYQE